jgi:hypothetical protein
MQINTDSRGFHLERLLIILWISFAYLCTTRHTSNALFPQLTTHDFTHSLMSFSTTCTSLSKIWHSSLRTHNSWRHTSLMPFFHQLTHPWRHTSLTLFLHHSHIYVKNVPFVTNSQLMMSHIKLPFPTNSQVMTSHIANAYFPPKTRHFSFSGKTNFQFSIGLKTFSLWNAFFPTSWEN